MDALAGKEFKKLLIVKESRLAVENAEYDIKHYVNVLATEQPNVYVAAVSVVAFEDIDKYMEAETTASTDKWPIVIISEPNVGFSQRDYVNTIVERYNASLPVLTTKKPPVDISRTLVSIEVLHGQTLLSNTVYLVDYQGERYLYIKGVFFASATMSIINGDPVPEWMKEKFNDGVTQIFELLNCSFFDNENTDTILRRVLQKINQSGHRIDFGDEIQHYRVITARNTNHMELVILHASTEPGSYDDIIKELRNKHNLGSMSINVMSFHEDKGKVRELFHKANNANSLTKLVFDDSCDEVSPIRTTYENMWSLLEQ